MTAANISLFFTAIAAISAAAAAWFMHKQTKLSVSWQKEEAKRTNELRVKEQDLQAVNSKILIAQMWNDFNRMVVESNDETRKLVGTKNFENLDPEMVKRVYLMFSTINVIEVAWLLDKARAINLEHAWSLIEDQATLLQNDKEAAKLALKSRGYSDGFLHDIWPYVFPEESSGETE